MGRSLEITLILCQLIHNIKSAPAISYSSSSTLHDLHVHDPVVPVSSVCSAPICQVTNMFQHNPWSSSYYPILPLAFSPDPLGPHIDESIGLSNCFCPPSTGHQIINESSHIDGSCPFYQPLLPISSHALSLSSAFSPDHMGPHGDESIGLSTDVSQSSSGLQITNEYSPSHLPLSPISHPTPPLSAMSLFAAVAGNAQWRLPFPVNSLVFFAGVAMNAQI